MLMVHVLIVEDERKTADMLRELVESHPDYLVVHTCDSIETATAYLQRNQPKLDLMFLDIHLADGESFEIFAEIEVTVPVIFCTAYDAHVLKAFKHNGIEYLLKPIRAEDMAAALATFERLRSALTKDLPPLGDRVKTAFAQASPPQKTFLVHMRDKMIPVAASEVACVMLHHEVVYLFNFQGERFPIAKKMEEMEQALDDTQFFRINRQMLVNRDAIREMEPYFNRKVVVSLPFAPPEKAIVSRLKVTPFMAWVEGR